MLERLGRRARHAVVHAGRHLPRATTRVLNGVANLTSTGRHLQDRGFTFPAASSERFDVLGVALSDAATAVRPAYLEFGVWEGEMIGYVSRTLTSPTATIVGFDSFEGLPEDWTATLRAGDFSTGGNAPAIDDPRVSFVKGWFDQTLATCQVPDHDLLVVSIDSDLYSSAVAVLNWAEDVLRVGDYVYFDEFHDRLHEGRAFYEFLDRTGYEFDLVATTYGLHSVLFRRTR